MNTKLVKTTTKDVVNIFQRYYELEDLVEIEVKPVSDNLVWKLKTRESGFIIKEHLVLKSPNVGNEENNYDEFYPEDIADNVEK